MYQFWYGYLKLKHGEKAKLSYMDVDSCIVYIKTDDIYEDITEDVEMKFDTPNYELNRSLPKGKNKKGISVMNNELSGKVMKEFIRFRAKTYSYLTDNNDENKKAKGTKKVCHKKET